MDRLNMQTRNIADENYAALEKLFPNALTEKIVGYDEEGKAIVERAIDVDVLRQEISCSIVGGRDERYQFAWPDKKNAILLANSPISMTLRPCREESIEFDSTQNIYVEGDNLDAIKLLQETYLEKIKLIYIDPPYNTGTDFVYEDDFAMQRNEYLEINGQLDDAGNRMTQNTETNGRYHTDWLNMIYSRIKLARNLLTEDGVIFISINDKEVDSLKKVCNEIFGEHNFIATLIWDRNHSAQAGIYKVYHEYILLFAKNVDLLGTPKSLNNDLFEAGAMKKASGRHSMQSFIFPKGTRFDAPHGVELKGEWGGIEKVILKNGRLISDHGRLREDVELEAAYTQINQMKEYFYGNRENLVDSRGQKIVEFYLNSSGKVKVVKERGVEAPQTTCRFGSQGPISVELAKLFGTEDAPFDSPKPIAMIKDFVARFTEDDDIVLDFFSGSATTAHAIMELNAEREESNRKYILVQIQEDLDYSLAHASKDGKKTLETAIAYLDRHDKKHFLTEIGKERIKLAANKIKKANENSMVDYGFRVLKVDSSNMKDVYYNPAQVSQQSLFDMTDNIKEDRTQEDLLFQVMLDLGVLLSSKIEEKIIAGKKVFNVADGFLIACFDNDVTEETVKAVAQEKPYYAVFRDSSMANDSVATNFEQIFATYSPETVRKVL